CWKCAFQHTPTFSIEPFFKNVYKYTFQTVDKFRGQVPRNFFAIEPEKSALWCATRQVDILNIERFLAFAARNRAAFLRC
ncbi:hypothetical protein, partial [Enterocloster bolteae]|uniref:hypothetical protein n=1 Tax=Enterocloster bolteae TaxID=208479 RepID=UPI002A7FD539